MSWQLIGDLKIGYEWSRLAGLITGDIILKVEHSTSYASFPGKAYALFAGYIPALGLRGSYSRSYPYGPNADLVLLPLPKELLATGIQERYVELKHDLYERIQADANWRVKIYRWVYELGGGETIDGNGGSGDNSDSEPVILDGNP
ncbi:MAG: hypothetical protein AAFN38_21720 [Cyanobacteria bacterium J06560_5]